MNRRIARYLYEESNAVAVVIDDPSTKSLAKPTELFVHNSHIRTSGTQLEERIEAARTT